MKNQSKQKCIHICIKLFSFILVFWMSLSLATAQTSREVIAGYVGWAGNPDSITVYIDDSFTAAEKADVRAGMQRWNDAGGKPKYKEVNAPPAKVTVKEADPGDGNAGIAEIETDADGKNVGVEIKIRNDPNPGLKETATHEFGHAIGLDDVDADKNAGDVMKGTGNTNGTDGALSDHDKTELAAAVKSISVPAPPPEGKQPAKRRALAPPMAIEPGSTGTLQFDLEFLYPPLTGVSVTPAGDPLVQVLFFNLIGTMLTVQVLILPGHGSGKFYLDIQVVPPEPMEPMSYLGWHFVNTSPVGLLTFTCPFEIHQTGNLVFVNWKDFHNYPDPAQLLRAHLTIDGNHHYLARGGDDFVIDDLAPGLHTFELEIDDYQINIVNPSALFMVEATPPQAVPLNNWSIWLALLLIAVVVVYRLKLHT